MVAAIANEPALAPPVGVSLEDDIRIAARHPSKTAVELYADIEPLIANIEFPRGYSLHLEGEMKGAQESNSALFEYAPHALFGILALLVLQFNSLRRPAIILMTIPLVLIGASAGLNLLWDRYRYELGAHRWGDARSPVGR